MKVLPAGYRVLTAGPSLSDLFASEKKTDYKLVGFRVPGLLIL